ncbi:MAG: sigma-70 family RNA polymerase sigma factor [Clostridia bacterium]|nr:sigma-70 family RNA polymerase sigma factor [Clostridia bacterium]
MERAEVPGASEQMELKRLVDQYGNSLLRTCLIYLTDWAEAEDALQEVFIRTWRHIDLFLSGDIRQEKAWLMRTAMNICHDIHKSKWFRHINTSVTLDELPVHLAAVLPEDHALLIDVCNLPERYKQILLLYYYQGMSLQETAEVLNISKTAANKRLHKAQDMLKGRLTEGGGDE